MPIFTWSSTPRYGTCLTCGTSTTDAGFVDTFVEVNVRNSMGEITGVIDAIFCGNCVTQMAQLFGNASRQQVEELTYEIYGRDKQIEKLKDEVMAWQQRFMGMANLNLEDFGKLAQLERDTQLGTTNPTPALDSGASAPGEQPPDSATSLPTEPTNSG